MELAAALIALAGLALLLAGIRRERGEPADVFAALDRLDAHDLLHVPPRFLAAAVLGAVGASLSWIETVPVVGAFAAGLASLVFTWLVWAWVWEGYRTLVDLVVVTQSRVPAEDRPAAAYEPPREQALSFRPARNGVAFLVALGVGGGAFYALSVLTEVSADRLATAAAGFVSAVGLYFAIRFKRALDAERDVRRIAGRLDAVDDTALLRALQENPRSRVLLERHADRLMETGMFSQAYVEYRAAAVGLSPSGRLSPKVARASAAAGADREPHRGEPFLLPYSSRPTAVAEPLVLGGEAERFTVLDRDELVRGILGPYAPWAGRADLLVAVDPPLVGDDARAIASQLVGAPLVMSAGPFARFLPAYRLGPQVVEVVLAQLPETHGATVRRVDVLTPHEILARYHVGDSDLEVAPDYAEDAYAELRRTAAVAALPRVADARES